MEILRKAKLYAQANPESLVIAGYTFTDIPQPKPGYYHPMIDSDSPEPIEVASKMLVNSPTGVRLWCAPTAEDMKRALLVGNLKSARIMYRAVRTFNGTLIKSLPWSFVKNIAPSYIVEVSHKYFGAKKLALEVLSSGNETCIDALYSTFYPNASLHYEVIVSLWKSEDKKKLIPRMLESRSRVHGERSSCHVNDVRNLCKLANLNYRNPAHKAAVAQGDI
jgi:hypothetical protein